MLAPLFGKVSMLRWAFRGFAVVIVLLLVVVLAGYAWLRQSLPTTEGKIELAGLERSVDVMRDAHGVPHIFAASERDAHFALGYVHAQDRLWQMETIRRAGAGRLAEIDASQLGTDKLLRTLGLYRRAAQDLEALAPDVREALQAYADGVNAFLGASPVLPPEFLLVGIRPEPWTPVDSVVWGKLMALQLSGNYRQELLEARLAGRLSPDQILDLYPEYPAAGHTTLVGLPAINRLAAALPEPLGPDRASNEWVVHGSRTASGKPILTNDPHLALESPILWYLAHVDTPTLQLRGVTIPGVPFFILGQNQDIAWGFTTTGTDVQDLFVETVDPADPTRYLTPDGSVPFLTREEIIQVKGAEPVTLTVRETRHGPVISDISEAAKAAGDVVALAFTALQPDDRTVEAAYRYGRARNWQEFRDAFRLFRAPMQNMVFADRDGNIGFIAPATLPIRKAGDGRVPVPGATGDYDWIGFVPFDALPQTLNPPSGLIVNGNNRIVGPDYPYHLTHDWDPPYRGQRIQELLDRVSSFTPEDSEEILADTLSPDAATILPLMLAAMTEAPSALSALDLLRAWDGHMRRDSSAALIYTWWLRNLGEALYGDELGDLTPSYHGLRPQVVAHMLTDARDWCDDVATDPVEDCASALTVSLDRTISELQAKYGDDPAAWRWGAAHRAPLAHPVYANVPLFGGLVDLTAETDGGNFTVNRGAHRSRPDDAIPFPHHHGAGYRAVYDLADPENSRFVIAGGQSGHPLSTRYGDLVGAWSSGQHVRIPLSRAAIAAGPHELLVLEPK